MLVIVLVIVLVAVACYWAKSSKFLNKPLQYQVQNLESKQDAKLMLNIIHQRILKLRDFLRQNIDSFPEYKPYINTFCKKIDNLILVENGPHSKYTSYTINKGDLMALCLRSGKSGKLHDLNLIMYVVIHELAHIACPDINHTPLFKKIFVFFLKVSMDIGIYQKVEYDINPHEYCGMVITEALI